MESMRESWTDERLDDLNRKIDSGFERVDADLRGLRVEMKTDFVALRGELKAGFEGIDKRFERMDARFERINERFEALHRLLIQSAGVLLAALVGLHFF
jgi:chromosome segregation ATPase